MKFLSILPIYNLIYVPVYNTNLWGHISNKQGKLFKKNNRISKTFKNINIKFLWKVKTSHYISAT